MTRTLRSAAAAVGRVFETNLQEFQDPPLRWFGIFLCFNFVQTAWFWGFSRSLSFLSEAKATPLSWPGFEFWAALRPFPQWVGPGLVGVLAVVGVVAGLAFWTKRWRAAWWLTLAALLVKALVFSFDYRLMGNYHYMPYWAAVAFLFVPAKRQVLPVLICLFYVSAGLLKPTTEWLSGNALLRAPPVSGLLLELSCAYVALLELVFIFGLLGRRAWVFWAVLGQLALFHAVSWQQVGYYYPLTMFALLGFLVVNRRHHGEDAAMSVEQLGRLPRAALAFLAVFVLVQLPQFVLSKDQALTGEGRMLSLNMLDAHTSCDVFFLERREGGVRRHIRPFEERKTRLAARIQCDPLIYLRVGEELCASRAGDPQFVDLDFYVRSKRFSDEGSVSVVRLESLCARAPSYALFGNDWIHEDADE